jgi:hypothetical protein
VKLAQHRRYVVTEASALRTDYDWPTKAMLPSKPRRSPINDRRSTGPRPSLPGQIQTALTTLQTR